MALTADRNTPMMDAELLAVPVAASTKIFAGAIVVLNSSGYATKGAVAATLTFLGRAEETVDNSSGSNGDKTITVRRKAAFKWKNYGSDAIVQADLGKTCYIFDDETVAKTNGSAARSAAGKVVGIESDGVWVEA